jgi:hypothetical protein
MAESLRTAVRAFFAGTGSRPQPDDRIAQANCMGFGVFARFTH